MSARVDLKPERSASQASQKPTEAAKPQAVEHPRKMCNPRISCASSIGERRGPQAPCLEVSKAAGIHLKQIDARTHPRALVAHRELRPPSHARILFRSAALHSNKESRQKSLRLAKRQVRKN